MGTNEELVPGELLKEKIMHPLNFWVKQKIKNKHQSNSICLVNNTNEEITHV